jgi:2-C-methyl-D-erythritol 2,4-cyclodiphosphate synthase
MRIGYGFDSHEFKAGVPLKIGGVEVTHDKGLAGHSDGDVLLHAITDALLGAVCAGDIGSHFPPSDPQWKGADSAVFLAEALRQVERAGYSIANIDSSLIMQAPKIGPHAQRIREHIAELLKLSPAQVSVKAKTPEGLATENTAIAHVVVLLTTRAEDGARAMHEAEATPQTEVDAEVEKVLENSGRERVALPKRK